MTTLICPYCGSEIKPHNDMHQVGDFIDCPVCAAELEIISTDPFEIQYVETEK